MRITKLWFLILGYVLFIYFSLPYARAILKKIYALLGPNNFNLLVFILCTAVLFGILWFFRGKGLKYLVLSLFLSFLVLGGANLFLKFPEERIHFLEYGLLGFLLYFVCKSTFKSYFVLSIFLVFLVGVGDEIIQYFLPNRVGDLRDVIMNFLGGLWGIFLAKFYSS